MNTNAWWSLHLPDVYRVSAVAVTTRAREFHRLYGAEILIGNSAENNGNNNPRTGPLLHGDGGAEERDGSGGGWGWAGRTRCSTADTYWDLFTLRSLQEQEEVEEVLRNTSFQLTNLIWMGLRRYVMGDKWFWMYGDSLTHTNWEEHADWHNACGCMRKDNNFLWKDHFCGDHLHFICLTDQDPDSASLHLFTDDN
ncbi:hypothetical protein LDENG_00298900 [Lucifuga dentata]|nr:hypothetical protein LDENG_00298900 [Lucifuga dentata]